MNLRRVLGFPRLGLLTSIALAACSGTAVNGTQAGGDGGSGTGDGSTSADGGRPGDDGSTASGFTTVFTIVMENHDYSEVVGSADAPYINGLIAKGGLATKYDDSHVHPSLPNYLYMISGSTQGIAADPLPTASGFPKNADNLGDQLQKAGVKWRSYQESAEGPCVLVDHSAASGDYAPKHNPFLYFQNIQKAAGGVCAQTSVDYATNFPADLASGTYKYMFITPNLANDGHDPFLFPAMGLKQSDAWAAKEIQKILDSATYKAGGVIFLTWDEAEGRGTSGPDQVPMIILSPKIKSAGFTSAVAYDHANFLGTVEDIFGVPRLGAAVGKASMMEFFK